LKGNEWETDEEEAEDDSKDDEDEDDDDSEMEIDAPAVEPGETLEAYFARTSDLWIEEAQSEFPDEKSKKILNKMAHELCKMFWGSLSDSK
jgi:hypothetical protein